MHVALYCYDVVPPPPPTFTFRTPNEIQPSGCYQNFCNISHFQLKIRPKILNIFPLLHIAVFHFPPPYLPHSITLYFTFSRVMGYNLSSYRTVFFLFPPTVLNLVFFTNIPPYSCSFVFQGVDMIFGALR
jgi:hypothetical protein